jgi:hypothetical protein
MSQSFQFLEAAPNSFIFEVPDALPAEFCESVIKRFEAAQDEQYPGRIGQNAQEDMDIKRSTDLVVSGKESWRDVDMSLFRSLGAVLQEFKKRFPFFKGPFKDMGYAIQRTLPGEFYHWHIDGGSHEFAQRQLVVVWYLNTVDGPGGETEFLTQNIKIKPEQGKMVLFPPFWTHEHRGVTLEKGVKYIATTWVVFS